MHYKPPDILSLKQLPGQCLTVLVGTFPPEENRPEQISGKKGNRNAAHPPRRIAALALLFPLCPGQEVAVQFAPQRFGGRAASRCPVQHTLWGSPPPSWGGCLCPFSWPRCQHISVRGVSYSGLEMVFQVSEPRANQAGTLSIRLFTFCFTQSGRSLYAFNILYKHNRGKLSRCTFGIVRHSGKLVTS